MASTWSASPARLKDAVRGNPRGASTITQQLVGNMHPSVVDRSDRSLGRKLREQSAAREMERHYKKDEILEAYLNQIHFGHRWYGIESAARHYFGKPAARLTIAEAATLAAVINGPAIFDPISHPDRAKERRDLVLALMAGQGFITKEQARPRRRNRSRWCLTRDSARHRPGSWMSCASRRSAPVCRCATAGIASTRRSIPTLQRAATTSLVDGLTRIEGAPGYSHPVWSQRQQAAARRESGNQARTADRRRLPARRGRRDGPVHW